MTSRTHIIVAEPSAIIRSGMLVVFRSVAIPNADVAEIGDMTNLVSRLRKCRPDVLIISPSCLGVYSLAQFKTEVGCKDMKIIALQSSVSDAQMLKSYDEVISLYDSPETIREKIGALTRKESKDESPELSDREKEIIVCVVKGMTNKQIAETLFLSVHTVMSHRRNISSKLQIHSTAGLTIYAILNGLVEIDEIKNTISAEK